MSISDKTIIKLLECFPSEILRKINFYSQCEIERRDTNYIEENNHAE